MAPVRNIIYIYVLRGRHICTTHTAEHANSQFTSSRFTLDSPKTQAVNNFHYLMKDTFLKLMLF